MDSRVGLATSWTKVKSEFWMGWWSDFDQHRGASRDEAESCIAVKVGARVLVDPQSAL